MGIGRRSFVKQAFTVASAAAVSGHIPSARAASGKPLMISTWKHGLDANAVGWDLVQQGSSALDAVEQGVRIAESDPKVSSVGYGGLPDADGKVTLDACIMNPAGEAGSVACIQHIMNPVSVARQVMEKTPHVMLVGAGALKFALANGHKKEDLLTENSKAAWERWKKKQTAPADPENHDTIGMLAMDKKGDIAGACTTSGWAWKIPGRVGDSPIIGAGLYIDNEIGGATATGKGEAVIREAGTFLVVEMMRQGHSPQRACEIAIERIVKKQADHNEFQVGFIALNKAGETGAYSIKKGFNYALYKDGKSELIDADHHLKI